jgi:tetratricopeptide (TPR) repeat protein
LRLYFPAFLLLFLIAWAPSLGGGFHFDDHSLFVDPVLQSPDGWREVWRPLQTRPLTQFTFWLSGQWGGRSAPMGYHAWNLLLHGLNVWMAWRALRSLRVDPAAAAIAVALFALHPMQSEPVNYVFARSTLLMSAFCLAALWCWVENRTWPAVAFFGAALLAKEECVTFPILLLSIDYWRRREPIRWLPAGAMLALAVAAGLRAIAATAANPGAGAGFASPVTPLDYARAQGAVIAWRYWRLLLAPWGFTVDPEIADPGWALGIAAWLLIAGLALAAWKQLAAGGFWFLAGLLLLAPSSSIFPAEDLAADRRMYLPLLAFAALAAVRIPRGIALGAVLVLAALSWHRSTAVWGSEQTLWREAYERSPGKVRPRIQLARVSPVAEARQLLREAAAISPQDPDIPNELGLQLLRAGNAAEALGAFGKALALAPSDAKTLNNRGVALFQMGQADAARQDFERALRLNPCLADARRNLALAGGGVGPAGACK